MDNSGQKSIVWLLAFIALLWGTISLYGQEVKPLLRTTWGQRAPYNSSCPKFGSRRCDAGCLPLAIAQIMNYYKYPAKGSGACRYKHDRLGTISVNFSEQSYEWADQAEADIAKLIYHCGVIEHARYSRSGTNPQKESFLAWKKYFGYSYKMRAVYRNLYTDAEWLRMIESELDNGRPVLYLGENAQGTIGHAWVCDGYNASGELHFNWGWNGDCDGYYDIENITPASYNYSYNNVAWIGIKPEELPYRRANLCFREHDPFFACRRDLDLAEHDPFPKNSFVEATFKVSNNGFLPVASTSCRIAFYLDDSLIITKQLSTVYAEIDTVFATRVACRVSGVPTGHHQLRAVLDPEKEIAEMDETDNVYEVEFDVDGDTNLPDLQIAMQPGHEPIIHASGMDIPFSEVSEYPDNIFSDAYLSFSVYNASAIPLADSATVDLFFSCSLDKSSVVSLPDKILEFCTIKNYFGTHFDIYYKYSSIIYSVDPYGFYRIDSLPLGWLLSKDSNISISVDKSRSVEELCDSNNDFYSFFRRRIKTNASIYVADKDSLEYKMNCNALLSTINDSILLEMSLCGETILLDTVVSELGVSSQFDTTVTVYSALPDTLEVQTVAFAICSGKLYPADTSFVRYHKLFGSLSIYDYSKTYTYFEDPGELDFSISESDSIDYIDTLYYSLAKDTVYIKWKRDEADEIYSVGCFGRQIMFYPESRQPSVEIIGDTTFCDSDSITLRSNDGFMYQWSTGELCSSITVGPGTYECIYVDGIDTILSRSFEFVDHRGRYIAVAADKSGICAGDTVILQASDAVVWDGGLESQRLQVTEAGDYAYSYEDSNCGTISRIVNVSSYTGRKPRILVDNNYECNAGIRLSVSDTVLWSTGERSMEIWVSDSVSVTATYLPKNGYCSVASSVVVDGINEPIITVTEKGLSVSVSEGTDVYWFANDEELPFSPTELEATVYEAVCVDKYGCITYDTYQNLSVPASSVQPLTDIRIVSMGRFAKVLIPANMHAERYEVYGINGTLLKSGLCSGNEFFVENVLGAVLSIRFADGTMYGSLLVGGQ